METILTIAVPVYNMESYLRRNLQSYVCVPDDGRLEVLILDNSSVDASGAIADEYARAYPRLFTAIHKSNGGYGSSVNLAVQKATGRYLRVVDADDWVDSKSLLVVLDKLGRCKADLACMDYTLFAEDTGAFTEVHTLPSGLHAGELYTDLRASASPFPTLHGTIFRTMFLRSIHLSLPENTYYVDEFLLLLSFAQAASIEYFPENLYRYRVGSAEQSISPTSMAARHSDRGRVILNELSAYRQLERQGDLRTPCEERLCQHAGNHFTTLYIYVDSKLEGRRLAAAWAADLRRSEPAIFRRIQRKMWILAVLNHLGVNAKRYSRIKTFTERLGRGN